MKTETPQWKPVGVIGSSLVIQDKKSNNLKHDQNGAFWGGIPEMKIELPEWAILKLAESIKENN